MQAQHIIILIGIGVCFLLLTVFIERAIKRAIRRSYLAGNSAGIADSSEHLDALGADIPMLARDRERRLLIIEPENLTISCFEELLNPRDTGWFRELISSFGQIMPPHFGWLIQFVNVKGKGLWQRETQDMKLSVNTFRVVK